MIDTFYNSGALDGSAALLASLLIGIAFGVALERAGFGSSRRLAGIFYFRDMAVLKVMFTAVIVAMLGVSYAKAFGWVNQQNVYFLSTIYAAQIAGRDVAQNQRSQFVGDNHHFKDALTPPVAGTPAVSTAPPLEQGVGQVLPILFLDADHFLGGQGGLAVLADDPHQTLGQHGLQ